MLDSWQTEQTERKERTVGGKLSNNIWNITRTEVYKSEKWKACWESGIANEKQAHQKSLEY